MCFCWEEKLFYFLQQDYRKKGNFTQLNRYPIVGELYSSRYTELSLNQPINKPNNQHAPSKSISTTFSNISKPILSLSLTCRKHTGNILSLFTPTCSLSLSLLFPAHSHSSPKNRAAIAWLYLNFFWIFFAFFILFLTSVGFYDLLDFILLL